MREKPLILLVDDEEIFLEIASVKLRSHGFETVTTNGVADALAKAADLLPDLVLSDIYMPPGPSGWEFALELRGNPKTREIKIAFFTSLRDPWAEFTGDRKKAVELLGNPTFFNKFDDVELLGEKVLSLIGLKNN